jgi:hypothetical protein
MANCSSHEHLSLMAASKGCMLSVLAGSSCIDKQVPNNSALLLMQAAAPNADHVLFRDRRGCYIEAIDGVQAARPHQTRFAGVSFFTTLRLAVRYSLLQTSDCCSVAQHGACKPKTSPSNHCRDLYPEAHRCSTWRNPQHAGESGM